jgi:CRP-like cAMP-binding protein
MILALPSSPATTSKRSSSQPAASSFKGDEAHELFVIKSGQARIQRGNRTLAELSDNDIFGEMALMRVLAQRLRATNETFG